MVAMVTYGREGRVVVKVIVVVEVAVVMVVVMEAVLVVSADSCNGRGAYVAHLMLRHSCCAALLHTCCFTRGEIPWSGVCIQIASFTFTPCVGQPAAHEPHTRSS
jgi:hypothetical protein